MVPIFSPPTRVYLRANSFEELASSRNRELVINRRHVTKQGSTRYGKEKVKELTNSSLTRDMKCSVQCRKSRESIFEGAYPNMAHGISQPRVHPRELTITQS